ncbi:hypothetical protein [Sulfolobus sp. E11-6]|uniref:hypothetical protein n=1 Tax=Sulfolobus sp. E11-6 TaxID=2663020 RepID=UPI00129780DE|nr:hypothetical protein [Sulfolobus sp. E11-6]QGA69057.1 hypothetical protein GFS33_10375 [Sulfolobus sp. E11-6]
MRENCYEHHVKTLLLNLGLGNQYNESIIGKVKYSDNNTCPSIQSGKYGYFFNIKDIVKSKTIRRLWLNNDYNRFLSNKASFIPIYIPAQDRIMSLKYWGKYQNFFHKETNFNVEFTNELECHPSGICEYEDLRNELDDPMIKKAFGLHWTFSIGLPYIERNIFLGNIFISVGNNDILILKMYHTYVEVSGSNVKYMDINFKTQTVNNVVLEDKDYITYFLVKVKRLGEFDREMIYFVPYQKDEKHYKDIEVFTRLAFLVLRAMYLKKGIDEYDYLNIGNIKEFKEIFNSVIMKFISSHNYRMNINIDDLILDESLEFKKGEYSIRMFVIDDNNDIIFIHPLITLSFLNANNENMLGLYSAIVNNVMRKSKLRKEFIYNLNNLHKFIDLRDKLINIIGGKGLKLEYGDVPHILKMFEKIYYSVLLNKYNVK